MTETKISVRMGVLETKFENMNDKIEEHCRANEKGFDDLARRVENTNNIIAQLDSSLSRKFDIFFEKADNRYASKISEKIVYTMIGIIVTSFLTLVLWKVGWKI